MDLDNLQIHQSKNISKVAQSIELLADQIRDIFEIRELLIVPKEYRKINKIVIAGMGGSNLGARIIKSVFADVLKFPIEIWADYDAPGFVDRHTLFILSSYSGNTEEVLSAYDVAVLERAKILAITAGGKLEALMLQENIPGLLIKARHNPSNQPRLALGYSVFAMMLLLQKSGILGFSDKEVLDLIDFLELHDRLYRPNILTKENKSKKIALKIHKKIPILLGGAFLEGNLHTLRNQICETSKNFADYLVLPDLNHYAMEGLQYPVSNKKNLIFVFFESDLYSEKIQKRLKLTQKIVEKNKIEYVSVKLKGKDKINQSFEFLQLGSWLSYYLAVLNGINPLDVPFVEWFKENL